MLLYPLITLANSQCGMYVANYVLDQIDHKSGWGFQQNKFRRRRADISRLHKFLKPMWNEQIVCLVKIIHIDSYSSDIPWKWIILYDIQIKTILIFHPKNGIIPVFNLNSFQLESIVIFELLQYIII